jgi:hypothetical protein
MPKGIQIVTVISPSYERVGREMIRRVKRYTGYDVKVIETTDDKGFETKLNLDRYCKGPTIFMDSDLWPLREWRPEDVYLGNCIQGCHDHAVFNRAAFPHTDCHKNGLEWSTYLNSGLLCLPLDKPQFRELFKVARQSWRDRKKGKKTYVDATDQASVNEAILTLGLPIQFLPEQYNCYLFGIFHGQRPYIPREILNLHGAGIPAKKKYARLKAQASVLSQQSWPMHREAVEWEFARQFALR